jgi:hypothetical protein
LVFRSRFELEHATSYELYCHMMEIEKLYESLLAKMETNKEEMKADRKTGKDFLAKMEAMKAWREKVDADMKAWGEEICWMRSETTNTRKETMACQEMEARQEEEEPSSVDRKPEVAEQREVPVEDAEVMPVGKPKKKRRRDRKLAAERRRQKNERAQCQDGCQTKGLAVARRGTSHHATVARQMHKRSDKRMTRRAEVVWRMRHRDKDNAAARSQRRQALQRRRLAHPGDNRRIRSRNSRNPFLEARSYCRVIHTTRDNWCQKKKK